jgi:hypothetical protein
VERSGTGKASQSARLLNQRNKRSRKQLLFPSQTPVLHFQFSHITNSTQTPASPTTEHPSKEPLFLSFQTRTLKNRFIPLLPLGPYKSPLLAPKLSSIHPTYNMVTPGAPILKKQSQDDTKTTEVTKVTKDSKDNQKAKNATETQNRRTQPESPHSHEIRELVRNLGNKRQQVQAELGVGQPSKMVEDPMEGFYEMTRPTFATRRLEAIVGGMKTSMKRLVNTSITLANDIEMLKEDIKDFEALIDFMQVCDEEYSLMLEEAKEQNFYEKLLAAADGTEEVIDIIYLDEDDIYETD